ncbi:MAG: hypothetical protein H6999_04575 [Hahellaceae bacterium]|nr:hypothetical protein [Hahellaceae bacterium]MCP5169012.1 hypothetical protein [Hahellaceae bacterium]
MDLKLGQVETAKTQKAGCGIRYCPEDLSEEVGFDFSAAGDLNVDQTDCASNEAPKTADADSV